MSTGFELKADLPLETPDDEKELSQARAECAERIARLLSALPSGPVLRSSKSSTLPKADVPAAPLNQDSGTRIRFYWWINPGQLPSLNPGGMPANT